MNSLEKIENERDSAASELKAESEKMKVLIDDEERYIKRNREARQEVTKSKGRIGARVQVAQQKIDLLEARLPREVHAAVSEREVEVNRLDYELKEQRREFHSRKYEVEQMKTKGARPADLREPTAEVVALEAGIIELESDFEEAKKALEAAVILRREALVRLADGKVEQTA